MARCAPTGRTMSSGIPRGASLPPSASTTGTRSAQLDKRAGQIEQQKSGLDAQTTALKQQRALLRDDLDRQRDLLANGLAQYPRVASLEREEAVLNGRLAELSATRAEADLRVTDTRLQKLSLTAEYHERVIAELRDLHAEAAELSEALGTIGFELDRLTIRAPVPGIVHQLAVHTPHSVVQPGRPLLTIFPQDSALRVSARINPRDADQLYVDQPVTLTFPAISSGNGPGIGARVDRISADVVTNEQTGHSFFEVETSFDHPQGPQVPTDTVLLPGTPVKAFIKTADRSPYPISCNPSPISSAGRCAKNNPPGATGGWI